MTKKSLGFMAATLMLSVSYAPAAPNKASEEIDRLVFEKLASLNIPPSSPCTDEVFLRRVYLDMIGTLPTKEEARRFLDSKGPNKRSDLIEDLFNRDEFADYWSMKWCDLLRVKAEFPSKLWPNAVQARQKARISKLGDDLFHWQKAGDLRSYLTEVRLVAEEDGGIDPDTRFGKWLAWAEEYAERVDPLQNGEAFRVAY